MTTIFPQIISVDTIKVAVYRVGVADMSESKSSQYTQTSDFAGGLVCMNSNVCITKVYTHSSQKFR